MQKWSVWVVLLAVGLGCSPGPHESEYSWFETRSGAVVCEPYIEVFPVNGPVNVGYDLSLSDALVYGCPDAPDETYANTDFGGDHYGIDVFAALGTPMVAPVTGTVVKIDTEEGGTNWAGGNAVKIKGECGWHYYLAHLDEIEPTLTVGQFIVAGEPIGTVGKTGNAKGTSPHLHFSVHPRSYTDGIDPFPLLMVNYQSTTCGCVHPGSPYCPTVCEPACGEGGWTDQNCNWNPCSAGTSCIPGEATPLCAANSCVSGEDLQVGVRCSDEGDVVDCLPDGAAMLVSDCPVDSPCNPCLECGPLPLELCDGEDNDCDGEVDEGYDVGEPCSVPACDLEGVVICDPQSGGASCTAVALCLEEARNTMGSGSSEEMGEERQRSGGDSRGPGSEEEVSWEIEVSSSADNPVGSDESPGVPAGGVSSTGGVEPAGNPQGDGVESNASSGGCSTRPSSRGAGWIVLLLGGILLVRMRAVRVRETGEGQNLNWG